MPPSSRGAITGREQDPFSGDYDESRRGPDLTVTVRDRIVALEYTSAVSRELRIGIMGAGTIGSYVGGCLAADGADVVFVGRERLAKELKAHGLVLGDLARDASGGDRVVAKERIVFGTDDSALADRDVVLCCVKSAQTDEVARRLATILRPGAITVSMQNGVRNADVLRSHLGDQIVLGGIVGFNVVSKGGGSFRRTTTGPLVIESSRDEPSA